MTGTLELFQKVIREGSANAAGHVTEKLVIFEYPSVSPVLGVVLVQLCLIELPQRAP